MEVAGEDVSLLRMDEMALHCIGFPGSEVGGMPILLVSPPGDFAGAEVFHGKIRTRSKPRF